MVMLATYPVLGLWAATADHPINSYFACSVLTYMILYRLNKEKIMSL